MKEKSCGAIVYKKENAKIKFLLVHQSNGHYSFPKGHMEEGESELETTIREIKEETNLDVEVDTSFREQITYFVESRNVMKNSVYFIATPITFNLINQEGEIIDCAWYGYEDVKRKIEFDDIIEIFEKAYNYIVNSK